MTKTPEQVIYASISSALEVTEQEVREMADQGKTVGLSELATILGVTYLTARNRWLAGEFPNARKDKRTSPVYIPVVDVIDYMLRTTGQTPASQTKTKKKPRRRG